MMVINILMIIMLAGSGAFIFWLLQILKNTYSALESPSIDIAYDGKYYPATIIVTIKYGAPQSGVATDFSLYEEKKIIGFTFFETKTFVERLKELDKNYLEELGLEDTDIEEIAQLINKPTIIKNAIVYAPVEGFWTWKFKD